MNNEKIYKILEVDKYNANKLLETGNCKLLGVSTISTDNEECPNETKFMYSIGQFRLEDCSLCSYQRNLKETVEYEYNEREDSLKKVCREGNYDVDF